MAKLIKNGQIAEDGWDGRLLGLEELNAASPPPEGPLGVILEPDQPPSDIGVPLERLDMVAIHFPVFTDGRGFSYARELRERGFGGEIRATGHFLRDQLHYLSRCGFDAFEFPDEADLEGNLESLQAFSDAYQADTLQKEPLFRRR